MKEFSSKIIGEVAVDTGRICIIDPCNANEVKETMNKKIVNEAKIPLGIIFNTELGDGTYPIYEKRNQKGELLEVVIKISGAVYGN